MRTHIAKALKARSGAIRSAIAEYNAIAPKFKRSNLDVDTVLRYVSFGEFDILRESQYDPTSFPWMRSAERTATVLHFKRSRAQEEIVRLNIEIRRLYSFMETEEKAWKNIVSTLQHSQPFLSFQAAKRLKHIVALNQLHDIRLAKLSLVRGYSGPNPLGCSMRTDEDEDTETDNDEAQQIIDTTIAFADSIDK